VTQQPATTETIRKNQDSRLEAASLSRSVMRVPYDPKHFNQAEMMGSFAQKGQVQFNWKSN